jgi:hypothetical protein
VDIRGARHATGTGVSERRRLFAKDGKRIKPCN